MFCLKYLILVLAAASTSNAVKINMNGMLTLGKEVMDTVAHYMSKTYVQNSRRNADKEPDRITMTVKSAYICRGLELCEGKFAFIHEYIALLANAIESIFDGILTVNENLRRVPHLPRGALFEEELQNVLIDIKQMFKQADSRITEDKENYMWTDIIKKISARFQTAAKQFVNQRLDGDPNEIKDVKKKLVQKLILAIIIVEGKYESRLCSEFNLCGGILECTRSLNTFLEYFNDISDDKARMFMRYFHEALPENLFSFLNEDTASEFQIILSDMIYSETVPTKEILLSVHRAVEARLRNKNPVLKKTYDTLLLHTILSDLDHFYPNRHRMYNFDGFLGHFGTWVQSGGRLHTDISRVMQDLNKRIEDQPTEMKDKLMNEVKVFLELTVDPEKR